MQALFDAIEKGNIEEVKSLIEASEDKPDLINCVLNQNRRVTPLFEAIRFGCFEIVKYLYELGAKLPRNDNPIYYATMYGRDDIFEFFISKEENFDIEAKVDPNKERTLLQVAASHTNPDAVKWLLGQGVNVDVQEDEVKCTALHMLAFVFSNKNLAARETCIEYLLNAGADVSIKMARNQTAYDIAIEYNYGDCFQQLYFNRLIKSLVENKGKVTEPAQNIINELVDKSITISELPALFEEFKSKNPGVGFQHHRQAQGLIYHALWEKQQKSQQRLLKIAGWMALSVVLLPVALIILGVWGWKKHTAPIKASEIEAAMYKSYKEEKAKSEALSSEKKSTGQRKPFPNNPDALSIFKQKKNHAEPNTLAKALIFEVEPTTNAPVKPEYFHGVISGIKEVLAKPGNVLLLGSRNQLKNFENKFHAYQTEQKKARKK